MIHLDTNYLIVALLTDTAEGVQLRDWLRHAEPLGISAIAWAEFLCGPLDAGDEALARALFDTVELLTAAAAEHGAELFNLSGRRSRSLADCLIAATALRCGARLATVNLEDFQPFVTHGLVLV